MFYNNRHIEKRKREGGRDREEDAGWERRGEEEKERKRGRERSL